MQVTTAVESISPDEEKVYSFDFTLYLAAGETIDAVTWSAAVESGTDASPEDILDGSPTIDEAGLVVSQKFSGCTDGVTYRVTAAATTENGMVYELEGLLACR